MYNLAPYLPPAWITESKIEKSSIPRYKLTLGRMNTPIHEFRAQKIFADLSGIADADIPKFYIKRDDMTSFDLTGNKVRKLEFLLADALHRGCDTVITIGGIQSNHARATAVAARQLGLQPHLILRVTEDEAKSVGLQGNLLLDRLVGATVWTVPVSVYARLGGDALVTDLQVKLSAEGKRVCSIPTGGSNPIGIWGYVNAVEELIEQVGSGEMFEHIVFACGSGGTAAGLAVGAHFSGLLSSIQLHAVCVCDDADYFYKHIDETARAIGALDDTESVRDWENFHIHVGKGDGYARSTSDELQFILNVSTTTGVAMDPVYTGKALYYFLKEGLGKNNVSFKSTDRVLFLHTGGVLGMYAKADQLLPLLPANQVRSLLDA